MNSGFEPVMKNIQNVDIMHWKMSRMYGKVIKQTGFMKHYYTLFSLVDGLEAQKTFEFGTGVSTDIILTALERTGGSHISCDVNPLSLTGVEKIGHKQWEFRQMNSLDAIKNDDGPFDFVLHDGSHDYDIVKKDINNIINKMKLNSILMIHDTENKQYIPSLKQAVVKNLNFKHEILTLPFGYGLTIVKILEDFNNGSIKTTWSKGK